MKQTTFSIFLILFVCLSVSAQRKPDRYRDSLKGPVKSVRKVRMVRVINESGTWVEQPPFAVGGGSNYDLEGFGRLGKYPQIEGYSSSNGNYGKSTFDENGNKDVTMHYSEGHQPIGKDLYIYDEDGDEIEEHRYKFEDQSWVLWQRTVSAYDARDHVISKLVYNGEGQLESGWMYFYDGIGNLSSEYLYDGSQVLKQHRVYTYELDSFRNWTKQTTYQVKLESGEWVPELVTYREIEYYKGWSDLVDILKKNRSGSESGF